MSRYSYDYEQKTNCRTCGAEMDDNSEIYCSYTCEPLEPISEEDNELPDSYFERD